MKFIKSLLNKWKKFGMSEDEMFKHYPEEYHMMTLIGFTKERCNVIFSRTYYKGHRIEFKISKYVEYVIHIEGIEASIDFSLLDKKSVNDIAEALDGMIETHTRPSGMAVMIAFILDCGVAKEHVFFVDDIIRVMTRDGKHVDYAVIDNPTYNNIKMITEEVKAIY